MSAIRLARAVTGREKVLKFAGAYHGHVDGLLAEAGSGLATQGIPASPGVTGRGRRGDRSIVPWNDAEAVRRACAQHDLAAIIAEPSRPTWAWSRPRRVFWSSCASGADADRRAAHLRRGHHRLSCRPAAGRRSSTASMPDLTVLGKIIGGGLPAAAYGGRAS